MKEKIKELLNSVRFWTLTMATISAWLADVSTSGFELNRLLFIISGYLTAVVAIGSADSYATKRSSKKEQKDV